MLAINGEKHVLHVDPGLSLSAYLAQHTRFNVRQTCKVEIADKCTTLA